LESVERGEQVGRYTFIGSNITRTVEVKGDKGLISDEVGLREVELVSTDPLELVKQALAETQVAKLDSLPNFFGGAVGYLAYDAVRYFERIPMPSRDDLDLPDAHFLFADNLIVFDHVQRRMKIIVLARANENPSMAYDTAVSRIRQIINKT
jgi:anthranilate synthase component 1